jgi:hypothetical protein
MLALWAFHPETFPVENLQLVRQDASRKCSVL